MNRAMYLACAVILCALPSAFGLVCNECTPNEAESKLCTMANMADFTNKTCPDVNATDCATTTIYGGAGGLNATSYVLDCVPVDHNCTAYETAVCTNATTEARNRNITIFSCTTACCNTGDKCNNPPPITPAPTEAPSPTGTGSNNSTDAPTDAATRSLSQSGCFFVIMAVYFGLK